MIIYYTYCGSCVVEYDASCFQWWSIGHFLLAYSITKSTTRFFFQLVDMKIVNSSTRKWEVNFRTSSFQSCISEWYFDYFTSNFNVYTIEVIDEQSSPCSNYALFLSTLPSSSSAAAKSSPSLGFICIHKAALQHHNYYLFSSLSIISH